MGEGREDCPTCAPDGSHPVEVHVPTTYMEPEFGGMDSQVAEAFAILNNIGPVATRSIPSRSMARSLRHSGGAVGKAARRAISGDAQFTLASAGVVEVPGSVGGTIGTQFQQAENGAPGGSTEADPDSSDDDNGGNANGDTEVPPPKPKEDATKQVGDSREGEKAWVRVTGPSTAGGSALDDFEGLAEELKPPPIDPIILKCGGKWRHSLSDQWTDWDLNSEWATALDAELAATGALGAIDAGAEAGRASVDDFGKRALDMLESAYNWKCEDPCQLKVTVLGFHYRIWVSVHVEEHLSIEHGVSYKVWLKRLHHLQLAIEAECVVP